MFNIEKKKKKKKTWHWIFYDIKHLGAETVRFCDLWQMNNRFVFPHKTEAK